MITEFWRLVGRIVDLIGRLLRKKEHENKNTPKK
jgi:hypothetical protein